MASNHSRYSDNTVDDFDEQFIDEEFIVVTDKPSWKISSVSPLHNLQYSVVKLKQYALKLKQMLTSSVSEKSSLRYKATFAIRKKLKLQSDDPHAIQITVTARNSNNDSANYNLAYEAVLLSWGVFLRSENTTHLPFLLDRGPAPLTQTVRTALTKLFDCCITQFAFTQNHLLLFNAHLAELGTLVREEGKAAKVSFVYMMLNSQCREKIIVDCDLESLTKLWSSDCEEELEGMSLSSKQKFSLKFYQKFQNQIFNTYNMDLAMMELVEVVYPKGSVKINGIVKMKKASVVRCFLNILNEVMKYILETNTLT